MSARFPETPQRTGAGRKLTIVAAIVALTTGASGYFMGLRQTEQTAARVRAETQQRLEDATAVEADVPFTAAPPAPTYSQLSDRTRQPNARWRSDLASLKAAPPFTAESARPTAVEVAALAARRLDRRAYIGAPPTVPHPIDQRQSASCLACHGQPTRIGGLDVPQMSHALHSQCIQCHAPAGGPGGALTSSPPPLATPALVNAFEGLDAYARGTRAHVDAPPTVPHTTAMRQNCVSCHGPGGSSVVKTTHPQRQNCVQCHALDADRETLPITRPPVPSHAVDAVANNWAPAVATAKP